MDDNGTKLRALPAPPAAPEKTHYAIRTGLHLIDERTGERWSVWTCSEDDGNCYLERGDGPKRRVKDACCDGKEERPHKVIDLAKAIEIRAIELNEDGHTFMVQLEDALGEEEQPNLPGTDEHPNWRRKLGRPLEELADLPLMRDIAGAMAAAGRAPPR